MCVCVWAWKMIVNLSLLFSTKKRSNFMTLRVDVNLNSLECQKKKEGWRSSADVAHQHCYVTDRSFNNKRIELYPAKFFWWYTTGKSRNSFLLLEKFPWDKCCDINGVDRLARFAWKAYYIVVVFARFLRVIKIEWIEWRIEWTINRMNESNESIEPTM